MTTEHHYQPAGWLRELARVQRPAWPWGLSIRSVLGIAGPLAVGLATDQLLTALWVSMGTLINAAGEGSGTYRSRFRQIIISTPIGAAGYFAGYLMVMPYPLVIAAMSVIAFFCGIVSSYGAAFSIGTMQALLVASLAIGLPAIGSFWEPAVLFLCGAALHAVLLGCEALVDRRRPQRRMLAELLDALAALAEARAGGGREASSAEAARRRATAASRALYAAVMETRRNGRTRETIRITATLDAADLVFVAILAETDGGTLRSAAPELRLMAKAATHLVVPAPPAPGPAGSDGLARRVALLAARMAGQAAPAASPSKPSQDATSGFSIAALSSRLVVGRGVLEAALALAICVGAAFSSRYVIDASHWYWVPLTVVLVMKVDFGSVFARAVLRTAGAAAGVAIGAGLLIALPKGPGLVLAIAALAALLPWAKSVSYAVQAVVLTPLVLILVDLILPMNETVDYGVQRLADTAIGGAIVVVFGYFLWPRSHARRIAGRFKSAMNLIATYLEVACASSQADGAAVRQQTGDARRAAYAALSDLRTTLSQSMAEPPPAGREAAAWLPVIAAAERICDRITTLDAAWRPEDAAAYRTDVATTSQRLRSVIALAERGGTASPISLPRHEALAAIQEEADLIVRRLEPAVEGLDRARSLQQARQRRTGLIENNELPIR